MKCKRIAAWLLVCILLLAAIPVAQADDADTVYVRKHVSLVYDNSGSMSMELEDGVKNLKWTYASYAAQIFAGLLNDTDSLTVTLMNENKGTKNLEVDLSGDRQSQVDKIRDITNYAKDGTPFSSVTDAKNVLVKKGLLTDEQIGDNVVNQSEQFWLVLTTDGRFEDGKKSLEELERDLEQLLKTYSNLQLVYFGIGTEGAKEEDQAVDLSKSKKLKAYPNFTAVYADGQGQIVSTMQELANRISGRYSVTKGIQFNGNKVTLRISGETSPIRNIAILAQKTDTKLLSAVDENGVQMSVARPANEQFPQNPNYDNIDPNTKGAHTVLITNPDGKFQPGTVTLTFSEPINEKDFSLMYEPAVYVKLTVEQKDASGKWVEVPYGQKVQGGKPLRVGYEICEDGTDEPLDAAKLPGVTTEHITCGDAVVNRGGEFTAPTGNANITATISMMDGAYTVSTVRPLQVITLDAYTFQVSDPLTFYPEELAGNTNQYIDFKILYEGEPATADLLTEFSVESGELEGTISNPKMGVFRFTPKQANCQPGDRTVELQFMGQTVASQKVTVKELIISYNAKAENSLTLFSNEVAANTQPIVFSVTRTQGTETAPLPQEDAGQFRIEAKSNDGTVLGGATEYRDGQLCFVTSDPAAQVGEYTVTLYHQDQVMATAHITVLQYNAQFSAQVFQLGDGNVDLFDLRNNQSALAFVIYADDTPCTGVQLEGMLGSMILLEHNCPKSVMKLDVTLGTHDGKAALIARPTSTASNKLGASLQKMQIAWQLLIHRLREGPLEVELTVQAPKGTEITGTLNNQYEPADMWLWLLILLITLVVLGLTALVIIANMAMPRMIPGTFTYYSIIISERKGTAQATESSEKMHNKFRIQLTWKPETFHFQGMTFTADSRDYFRKGAPICLIANDDQLEKHSYQDSQFSVENVVRELERYCEQEFVLSGIKSDLRGMVVARHEEMADGATHFHQYMSDYSFVVHENGNMINLWLYRSGFSRQEENQEENQEDMI